MNMLKNLLSYIKKSLLKKSVCTHRAKLLPQGVTEFDKWSQSIVDIYNLPDNDSVRFMLATMILHAKESDNKLPLKYFGVRAQKSAANQVAAGVMQELKERQKQQVEAAAAALTEGKNE